MPILVTKTEFDLIFNHFPFQKIYKSEDDLKYYSNSITFPIIKSILVAIVIKWTKMPVDFSNGSHTS